MRTHVITAALCTALAGQARAGQLQADSHAVEGPPLTIQAAIDEALQNNTELSALRQQIDVTRQRPTRERGLNPPMADATVWQWPINSLNPANTNMYMFMVGQELPGRGKRELRAAVVATDVTLAENDVAIRARQIVDEIKQAYASLFIARRAIEVHRAGIDLLREIADASHVKYASGRISQQDVLRPVVELSKLHNDIIMFDEQASTATARLNVLLDRAPEQPIGPLVEPLEQAVLPATADLQRTAIDRQPELQRARIEIGRADAELASARGEYKPDFIVQGGYLVIPGQTDAWLGKIGITWPRAPWSRGRVDARVAELTAAVRAAKTRERALENRVRLAVQEAYVRATSAQQRAALLRTTILPQSQQVLDVSRVGYQTDRVEFQAVIDNERTLLAAQMDYFRALTDFAQATADLERAIGTDLPAGTIAAATSSEVK